MSIESSLSIPVSWRHDMWYNRHRPPARHLDDWVRRQRIFAAGGPSPQYCPADDPVQVDWAPML